jgi:hypothetical protein
MTLRAAWPALFLLAGAAGCADPESVKVSDEPKPSRPGAAPVPPEQKKFRTLGAIYAADGGTAENAVRWWFLKFSGPSELVAQYEADVRKLIESVQTTGGPSPITWTLPPGWVEEKGGGGFGRFATLKSADGKAVVTVSQAGGTLLDNVRRWWTQLWGQERGGDITGTNLFDYAKQTEVRGRVAFVVDVAGPKDPAAKGMMMPPGHGAMPPGHGQ